MTQNTEKETEQGIENLDDTKVKYRGRECKKLAWIGSLRFMAGDLVEVSIRGRADQKITAVFWCFNQDYGWLWLRLDDNDMVLRLKDIKYIRKLKK